MALLLTLDIDEPVYIGNSHEICIIATSIDAIRNPITNVEEIIAQVAVVINDQPFVQFACREKDMFHIGDNIHIKLSVVMPNKVKFRYRVPQDIPILREKVLLKQTAKENDVACFAFKQPETRHVACTDYHESRK